MPVFLGDGRILETPGYDPKSGLVYEPNDTFPPVPASVSPLEATAAANDILELVEQFPYAKNHHKAVFLAATLTPFVRHAFAAPVPAFLFDGNVRGSGKSLQTDIISIMATGREMTRTSCPQEENELRKTIVALLMEGDSLCLFDNLSAPFGGPVLDELLTSVTYKGRILGVSKTTRALPNKITIFATGNNMTLKGDSDRRVLLCRLEAKEENPEERKGFKIPDLIGYAKEHRGRLVVAALSILRAFHQAGQPDQGITALGGYDQWNRTVRQAVYWAMGLDPCAGKDELRELNDSTNNLGVLLQEWQLLNDGNATTAAEAIRLLREDQKRVAPDPTDGDWKKHQTLYDILLDWNKDGKDLPSPRIIGNRLRAFKGRVVNKLRFVVAAERRGVNAWKVEEVEP